MTPVANVCNAENAIDFFIFCTDWGGFLYTLWTYTSSCQFILCFDPRKFNDDINGAHCMQDQLKLFCPYSIWSYMVCFKVF